MRICAAVYWFNPFLLIMLKESENDIENLCDARVIDHCSNRNHRLYRRLLLRTVVVQKSSMLPGILLTLLPVLTNVSFALSAPASKPEAAKGSPASDPVVQSASYPLMEESETDFNETAETEIPASENAAQTTPSAIEEYDMYTVSDVNIRDVPSNKGTIIQTLSLGSMVTVTGASREGWFYYDAATDSYLPW